MKEIQIVLTELTKEESVKVKPQQILIYNKLTGTFDLEWNDSKKFTGRSKSAYNGLVYFSFKKKEELEYIQ